MIAAMRYSHLDLDPFNDGFTPADTIIDHNPFGSIQAPTVIVDLESPVTIEMVADLSDTPTVIGPAPAPDQIWWEHGIRWERRGDHVCWAILD